MRSYTFIVDNKEYVLRYTFNAICDLEEEAKMGISLLLSQEKVGLNTFRLLVWAGLKWKDHGITKQRAGEILNRFIESGGNYNELASEISKLLLASLSNESMTNENLGE